MNTSEPVQTPEELLKPIKLNFYLSNKLLLDVQVPSFFPFSIS